MQRDLLEGEVKVAACGTCLAARALGKDELIEGIEVGAMMKLAVG